MASEAQPAQIARSDPRTIVGGGVKLGVLTVIGVVLFALISRAMAPGTAETVVQSLIIVVGGAAATYLPPHWVRPYEVDTIAWGALLGVVGAVAFTVLDTAVLRPIDLYHWTWDAIGGGSGFWYIPVWWMGAAVLAWLGGWVYANAQESGGARSVVPLAAHTIGIALILFTILVATGVAPFHASIAALAYGVALILYIPLARAFGRR